MTEDDDDKDGRTQRLVAELAEVRRRMSRRAVPTSPIAAKSRADASGSQPRISTPPPPPATSSSSPPRPALGRLQTQRIMVDPAALVPHIDVDDEAPPRSQRLRSDVPTK